MANFTYADYTKFIEEITEAANKTFDMKEVANLLYNVHGIKKEIRVIHCYSGDKSPFLNVFLTKEGTFKFVSNFKNENEFNEATDVYSSQYFNEFEETVMRPFYANGTIQPLSIDRITYDMVGIIMSADNYKLDSFTMGNEKHDYYNLPDYFIPLKKAKVLSVTKVKGSYDYRIRFRLTNKTFQIKYFTVATCNESSAFENSIKERVANGEDYPTVFADDAFYISINGLNELKRLASVRKINQYRYGAVIEQADDALLNIKGLDDESIISACQLVVLDSVYRAGWGVFNYETLDDERLIPDAYTIANIRIMVNRALDFFNEYGPVTKDGFKFIGGYTETITTGDGDFLTEDTLWDFKVSKKPPLKEHTLQLLIYYLMGKHSVQPYYEPLTKIGIYNPRLNMVYTKKVSEIDKDILNEIETEIIGYD